MEFKQWLNEEIKAVKIQLPSVRQNHKFDCGAAALRSVAEFFKVGPEDHDEFIKACKTNTNGTHPEDIIRAARSFGLKIRIMNDMSLDELFSFVDMRRPIIVCMQAWDETKNKKKNYEKNASGHYVVVIGHDEKHVYIEDPVMSGNRGVLSHKEFLDRWHDKDDDGKVYHHYGIVLWKPMGETPEKQDIKKKKKIP